MARNIKLMGKEIARIYKLLGTDIVVLTPPDIGSSVRTTTATVDPSAVSHLPSLNSSSQETSSARFLNQDFGNKNTVQNRVQENSREFFLGVHDVSSSDRSCVARTTNNSLTKEAEKFHKRKGKEDEEENLVKIIRVDTDVSVPIPTVEEISDLMRIVKLHKRATPVFLWEQMLQESDTRFLLLQETEKLLEFLTAEEKRALDDECGQGVNVPTFDAQERFHNVNVVKWFSDHPAVVLHGEWNKLTKSNNVEIGDIVQLWGCRVTENGKLGFAVNFKKSDTSKRKHS